MIPVPRQNQRQFLQTLGFSAATLLAQGAAPRIFAQATGRNYHLFLLGDWGAIDPKPQGHVAATMAAYARQQRIQPAALLLFGDNFYGQLNDGVNSPRWQTQFKATYSPADFHGPSYALIGNRRRRSRLHAFGD